MSRVNASYLGSVSAIGLTKSFGGLPVLDSVTLTIGRRARVGIIGPNGVGKTTLLRILAGLDRPDAGRVTTMPPEVPVGYLPQEDDAGPREPLVSYLERRTGVAAARTELEHRAACLSAGHPRADVAYAGALSRYLALGGPDLGVRATKVCAELGLAADRLAAPMSSFSGGQRARARLAAILLARFGVLLLDEPTNNLDFAGLEQLEAFLDAHPGGVVVVSHDRAFLERTVEHVIELDEHSHRATAFAGGWDAYLEARAALRHRAEEAHARSSRERDRLLARAQTMRQWADVGARAAKKRCSDNDKTQRDWRVNRGQRRALAARAVESAAARIPSAEKPWEGWKLHIELTPSTRGSDVVLRLDRAVIVRGTFRLGPIDVEIRNGERVAILGRNGTGKSTLLSAIVGSVPLAAGRRFVGPGVTIGEMDQDRRLFLDDTPLLNSFPSASGMTLETARSLLAKFALGPDHVCRPSLSLSPGERTRALLALMSARAVNCLVLDEPTNHLDLPAIEQLEAALAAYRGTLILISHDRRFLEAVGMQRTIDLETRLAHAW